MSSRRSNKLNKRRKELPTNALLYCPQYISWDKEVREETKTRFRAHYTERRKVLVQCIDATLDEVRDPVLRLHFNHAPLYQDSDTIIQAAFKQIDTRINEWGGVQFSPQFIKEFNKTSKTMDKKIFIKGAKNHQDQTSWKVAGNHFFAPYLADANRYFHRYCQCITNVSDDERDEIYRFVCIVYIVTILTTEIKFHRTKGKSLIRQKTTVKSTGIHVELERLYPALKVRSFIAAAKRKRKQEKGTTTIISEEFHNDLLDCCHTLYREQKQKVYNICGVSMEVEEKESEVRNVYPEDLMDSETDVDHDKYDPYQSPSCSIPSTPSPTVARDVSNRSNRNGSRREFQSVNPRNYSVRNEMNRDRNRERRRHRETAIRQMHDETSGIVSENDRFVNESVVDTSSLDNYDGHRYIASRHPDNTADHLERELRMENQRLLGQVVALRQAIATVETYAAPVYDPYVQSPIVHFPLPIRRRNSNPYLNPLGLNDVNPLFSETSIGGVDNMDIANSLSLPSMQEMDHSY
eukprot:85289_1